MNAESVGTGIYANRILKGESMTGIKKEKCDGSFPKSQRQNVLTKGFGPSHISHTLGIVTQVYLNSKTFVSYKVVISHFSVREGCNRK